MVAQGAITTSIALEKLDLLRTVINPRLGLPKSECDARIIAWQDAN